MADPRDQLQQYVSDMCAVQRHVHEALETQCDDQDVQKHHVAAEAIRSAKNVVRSQLTELESHLDEIGGDGAAPIKDAVAEALGFAAGVIGRNRSQQVSKMLRDDYTALSQSSICYNMLDATGKTLGSPRTCELAQTHAKQLQPLLQQIERATPQIVALELADDIENLGDVVEAIGDEVRDMPIGVNRS